jgi:PAS domain S-box-containing protein
MRPDNYRKAVASFQNRSVWLFVMAALVLVGIVFGVRIYVDYSRTISRLVAASRNLDDVLTQWRVDAAIELLIYLFFASLSIMFTKAMLLRRVELTRLEDTRLHLATIVEFSNDAIISKDLNGIILSWNSGAERLFHYRPEEVIGQSITILIPPEQLEEERRILQQLQAGTQIEHLETVRLTKEEQQIDVSITSSPLKDHSGKIIGASKIIRDITELKLGEQALRENEKRLQFAYSELQDANKLLMTQNKEIQLQKEEMQAQNEEIQNQNEELQNQNQELERLWEKARQDEEKVRISEARLRFALESSHIGSWDLDLADNNAYRSIEHDTIFGYSELLPEWTYDIFLEHVLPEDRAMVDGKFRYAIENCGDWNFECRIRRVDGETRWIWATGRHTLTDEGMPSHMAGIVQDVTERKLLEQQFQQAQRLEGLGVLAGGIAHDFNNILAIIMGNCSLVKIDSNKTEDYIIAIEKAAARAAELCRLMLAYAGKNQLIQANVDIRSLVNETVDMLKQTLPQNISVKYDSLPGIQFLQGDASQLSQIVMNMIINASEAIGAEQGEVRVTLSETKIKAGNKAVNYLGKAIPYGRYVCLEVADTGCGMNEEVKQHLFEPFYTTKFTGRGLGMSAVLGIINSHKGALQLSSQLGQGTTFRVYLPVKESETTEKENELGAVPSAQWQGSGTILLVEDEAAVMSIAKIMLKALGFAVIEASNGKEALELYQKRASDITMVVTDIGMPVMNGYELFRELKQRNPELPIIISSGFGNVDVVSQLPGEEIAGLVSKPYNFYQLRDVLKKVGNSYD